LFGNILIQVEEDNSAYSFFPNQINGMVVKMKMEHSGL